MEILKHIEAKCGRVDRVYIFSKLEKNTYSEDDDLGQFVLSNLSWFQNQLALAIDSNDDNDSKIELVLDSLFEKYGDFVLATNLTFFKPTRVKFSNGSLVSYQEGAGYNTPLLDSSLDSLLKHALSICERHFNSIIDAEKGHV